MCLSKVSLLSHRGYAHSATRPYPYFCELCDEGFKKEALYDAHQGSDCLWNFQF